MDATDESGDGEQIEIETGELSEMSPFTRMMEMPAGPRTLDVLLRHSYTSLNFDELVERTGFKEEAVADALDVFRAAEILDVQEGDEQTTYGVDTDSELVDAFKLVHRRLAPVCGDVQAATQ